MPYKIGITGGIGSGKSTVCRFFAYLGVRVYDSDRAARQLMNDDPAVVRKIQSLLGSEAYTNGTLNRRAVAARIFNDTTCREALNGIVHPALQEDFQRWAQQQTVPYVLQEAAILFESGADRFLDATVTVTAPEVLRIRRTLLRDQTDLATVRKRIAAQMNEQERIARSDYIIHADDQQLLIPQILTLHERFIHL